MIKILSSLFRKKPSETVKKQGHINTPTDIKDAVRSHLGYTVVNAEKSSHANLKRIYYRIIVPAGATDAHLLRIFKELDVGEYDEVKVWCYKSIDEIRQYAPYSVAMLERSKKRQIVRISR